MILVELELTTWVSIARWTVALGAPGLGASLRMRLRRVTAQETRSMALTQILARRAYWARGHGLLGVWRSCLVNDVGSFGI